MDDFHGFFPYTNDHEGCEDPRADWIRYAILISKEAAEQWEHFLAKLEQKLGKQTEFPFTQMF